MNNQPYKEPGDDELYELKRENLVLFLEEIKNSPSAPAMLKDTEVEDILKYFNDPKVREKAGITYIKENNSYMFKPEAISKFVDIAMDMSLADGLRELVRDGFVEVLWDEKLNDFVYKKTDKFYGQFDTDTEI